MQFTHYIYFSGHSSSSTILGGGGGGGGDAAAIAAADIMSSQFEEVVKPLKEQNRMISERLNRLQVTLDQMIRNQRERDSNSNLNRDMVLLVILIVMIQAVLNWILSTRAQQMSLSGGAIPPPP